MWELIKLSDALDEPTPEMQMLDVIGKLMQSLGGVKNPKSMFSEGTELPSYITDEPEKAIDEIRQRAIQ
jgi:membrane-anchored protein YejM (alkaline phosphatase superfamily)